MIDSYEAQPATHLAVGRLDDDEWPDLALTDFKPIASASRASPDAAAIVTILWGTPSGVGPGLGVSLKVPNARATAIGDLNADGHGDLVVAVYQGSRSTRAPSQVFLGRGGRELPDSPLAVITEGAEGATIARPAASAPPVAVFANSLRRTLDDAVPVRLYWGSRDGFSAAASVDIPNLSGYKSSASDLNGDGHVDLILVNAGDVSEEVAARALDAGINIYWGGADGAIRGPGPTRFDRDRRAVLPAQHAGSINVADLDADGFLDVVVG
ncbi:MAG: VCBS repeat-containing protein [Verrucomicrobia bacterium]|nr:VCBS repeat-containing protein [Verrucomicrobiota bacterium]